MQRLLSLATKPLTSRPWAIVMGLCVAVLTGTNHAQAQSGAEPNTTEPSDTTASESSPRVVLVAPKNNALVPLLRAELRDLGLEVVEGEPNGAANEGITYRVVVKQNQIEVSIFDIAAGKVTLREIFAQADGSPIETRTAVLHAVELLRWHLNERQPWTKPDATSPPSPVNLPSPVSPPRGLAWQLTLLPQVLYSPGGSKLGAGAGLDVTMHAKNFGARVFASTLLLPNRLTRDEGTAEATPRFFGLQAVVLSNLTTTKTATSLGAGLSLVSTRLRGTTKQPYQAHDDNLLTLAPLLELRTSQSLSETFALTFSAMGMAPLRSASLRFAEREVGTHGTWFLSLGIGLEATLN